MLMLMDGAIFASRPLCEKDAGFYDFMFELCDRGSLPVIANNSKDPNGTDPRPKEVRKK